LHPTPATCQRTRVTALARLAAATLVSAVILSAGLAFLISLAARRPLIALAAEAILAAVTIAWLRRSPAAGPVA
jgi:hypothetical protein